MSVTPSIPSHSEGSLVHDERPANPANWWRRICEVTPNLFLSGGLSGDEDLALNQLNEWAEAGITHYIAVHGERDDSEFVHANSNIICIVEGVDDNGTPRDPQWFEDVTSAALEILEDPNAVIMTTCWMGVNRGPSAAYAILRALGWESVPALRAIRTARPIAGIIYAPDAAQWWVERNGGTNREAREAYNEVVEWLYRNPLDVSYVIRAIGSRTAA